MEEKTISADRTLSQIEMDLIAELAESGSDNARSLFLEWQNLKMKKLESVISKLEHNCNYCGKTEPCEGEYPEGCFYSDQASEPTPQRKIVQYEVMDTLKHANIFTENPAIHNDEVYISQKQVIELVQEVFAKSQQHPPITGKTLQECFNQIMKDEHAMGKYVTITVDEAFQFARLYASQPFNPWVKTTADMVLEPETYYVVLNTAGKPGIIFSDYVPELHYLFPMCMKLSLPKD